jgi:Tol biopolymer transport system component
MISHTITRTSVRRRFLLFASLVMAIVLAGVMLLGMPTKEAEAAFPGYNGKIVFESNRSGTYQLYTMNHDGSDQTQLTSDQAGARFPAWSPNGVKIAFTSYADGEIYTMNADGSEQTRVTDASQFPQPLISVDPAWSPDGQKIAFAGMEGESAGIWVKNADGSGQPTFLASTGEGGGPAWSPDGSKIAFFVYNNTGEGSIHVMDSDGSNPTQITHQTDSSIGSMLADFNPSWSPDGSKILFDRVEYDLDRRDIYAMNPDGSGQTNLTSSSQQGSMDADWSPDGQKIAFWRFDGIYTMNSDGSGQARLTNNGTFVDTRPSWQPIPSDTTKPTITITTPPDGATYKRNSTVMAAYQCTDEAGGSGLNSCVGSVPNGSTIDTRTTGAKTFTVTATDNVGNTDTKTITYYVTNSGKPSRR